MKLSKYQKLVIYLIIFAAIIRFAILSLTSISGDACWHTNVARFIAEQHKIPLFEGLGRSVFWAPPLFHILSAILYIVFGAIGLKLLTAISGTLSLIFVFLIAKGLFDEKIAFWTTLFVAFIPDHIYSSTISYVDTTLCLFVLGSIYFALKNKIILAGIFSGLGMLTKYQAAFGCLVVLAIIFMNNKNKIKNLSIYVFVSAIIGVWWYIRNWILLGNPIWDFLNNFFKGYVTETVMRTPSILNLISPKFISSLYLSLFGIPNGDYSSIAKLNLPFFDVIAIIWLIGTLIYLIPVIFGLKNINLKEKRWKIILVWFISFLIFTILYVYDAGDMYSRFIMPLYPVLGILWAIGILNLNKIIKKNTIKKMLIVLLTLIIIGFVCIEFGKAVVASKQWKTYTDDFRWVQDNIPKDEKVLTAPSQCVAFYIHRETVQYNNDLFSAIKNKTSDIKFAFIDDLKTRKTSRTLPEEFFDYLSKEAPTYNNTETGTVVYKLE